jgi:hypothetical protein
MWQAWGEKKHLKIMEYLQDPGINMRLTLK